MQIQIFFAFFCVHLCFLRTAHRDRMSSLKVGQVCPGYTGCPMLIHHALTFCDVVFPYILGLLVLPMIVKAND